MMFQFQIDENFQFPRFIFLFDFIIYSSTYFPHYKYLKLFEASVLSRGFQAFGEWGKHQEPFGFSAGSPWWPRH